MSYTKLQVQEAIEAALRQLQAAPAVSGDVGLENLDASLEKGSGLFEPAGDCMSWSDEVESSGSGFGGSSSDGDAVVCDGKPSLSESVKKVRFGGLVDEYVGARGGGGVSIRPEKGFFASYVRVPKVDALVKWLQREAGCKLPKAASVDIALCGYTTGTVPDAFVGGKERLKGLAVIGDAALSMHVVTLAVQNGVSVASVQATRSSATNDKALSEAFWSRGLERHVNLAPGVPRESKATATAVEAVIGVLSLYRDSATVARFVAGIGVVSLKV